MVLRSSGRRIWRLVPFAIGLLLPVITIAWLMPGPTVVEDLGPEAQKKRLQQQIQSLKLALAQSDAALSRERNLSRRLQRELQDASRQIVELTVFRNGSRVARAPQQPENRQQALHQQASGPLIVTGAVQIPSSRNVRVPPLVESTVSPYAPRRLRQASQSRAQRISSGRQRSRTAGTSTRPTTIRLKRFAARTRAGGLADVTTPQRGDVVVRALGKRRPATVDAGPRRVVAALGPRNSGFNLTSVTAERPTVRQVERRRRTRPARFTRPSRLGRLRRSARRRPAKRVRKTRRPRSFFNRMARRGVFGPGYVQ